MNREQKKEEIRSRISCKDYLEKSKSGMYCCPYCNSGKGHNGSGALKVYDTNTWTCHACGKSGDVLDLIAAAYNTDFNTAFNMAAEKLGLTEEKTGAAAAANANEKSRKKAPAAEKAADQGKPQQQANYSEYYKECSKCLKNSPEAISYLLARGISLETALAANVGFDPQADPAQSGHKTARIIMPTSLTHYVGRRIDGKAEFAKMNNKGGSPSVFNIESLYSGAKEIFVTEGAFDAMSVCEVGAAAVALNSTSNVSIFLNLLKEFPAEEGSEFIICFDNDENPETAKRTAAEVEKLKTGLLQLGYRSITANIAGSYKDANEALTADRAAFKAMIEAAKKELHRDYLTDFLDKIQSEAYKPYQTELTFFDKLLGGGVIPQSLLILMAAPGAGKTTLCQQIAEAMAAHKKPVVYLNLEMSREQMIAKAISCRLAKGKKGEYTAKKILQGYSWTNEEKAVISAEIAAYRKDSYPYMQYNPDNVGSSLDNIKSYLELIGEQARAAGKQAPAVIIDYLHLISTEQRIDNQELIKQAVKVLKDYAVKYDSFVIAISATNRLSNENGQITMGSGRDSSNIEYTGDYMLSLNYYEIDKGDVKPGEVDKVAQLQKQKYRKMIMRVLKGRFVAPGKSARMYFNAAQNIFYGEDENGFSPAECEFIPFEAPAAETPKAGKRR